MRPERTYNNADGHLSYYAASDRTDAPVLTTIFYPSWVWVLPETRGIALPRLSSTARYN